MKSETTLTREEFVHAIACAYAKATASDPTEFDETAEATLSAYLEAEKIEYGDKNFSWNAEGAAELADEDMSCWEEGPND